MKRKFLSLLFIMTSMVAGAQVQVSADATLKAVTIYSKGAELQHQARVSLPAGSRELVIGQVAGQVDESSIRIGTTAGVTVMSLRFRTVASLPEGTRNQGLEDSARSLGRALARLEIERETNEKVLALLDKNNTLAGVGQGMSVAELMRLADYYKSKQLELKTRVLALEEEEEVLQAQLALVKDRLQTVAAPAPARGTIVAQLMVVKAGSYDFQLSYISPSAAWSPAYDLRAANTTGPLQLAYKAQVTQNTGIDWKQVQLTLSTGNPARGSTAPQLQPWHIDLKERFAAGYRDITKSLEGTAPGIQATSGGGQPGAGANVHVRGLGSLSASSPSLIVLDGAPYDGLLTDINPGDIATMSVLKDATATSLYGARGANGVVIVTTKNKSMADYTHMTEAPLDASFEVKLPYDIASNEQPHSVAIQNYQVPASYHYYAAPRLDPDAFLMASMTGYGKWNLLPGMASLIMGQTYVGKSLIDPYSVRDTLELSMGRDKKIVIKREKVGDLSSTKLIGGNRREVVTWEIKVRNNKPGPVQITLVDQYPVSDNKELEVSLLEPGDATVQPERGMLTWNLDLPAGSTRTLRFSYALKYPREKVLTP